MKMQEFLAKLKQNKVNQFNIRKLLTSKLAEVKEISRNTLQSIYNGLLLFPFFFFGNRQLA